MTILGIDEVGRGPLAGPLVVGAVILPDDKPGWINDLQDSKKLTPKKRQELSIIILEQAPATGLGWVSPAELDEIGISAALKLATKRAVKAAQEAKVPFSQIIIDGKVNFLKDTPLGNYVSTMPKADDLVKEVSAASIIAKVARDQYMCDLAERYPEYGFDQHVGYGTAKHRAAIDKYGICPEHRRSFEPIKSIVGFVSPKQASTVVKNTTSIGKTAEAAVCKYLQNHGHLVVARNFKTYFYEIDIISIKDHKIYFTEVKYRRTDVAGGGLAAIDQTKTKQMQFAAECFLKYHARETANYDPLLAVADVHGNDFKVKTWFPLD